MSSTLSTLVIGIGDCGGWFGFGDVVSVSPSEADEKWSSDESVDQS